MSNFSKVWRMISLRILQILFRMSLIEGWIYCLLVLLRVKTQRCRAWSRFLIPLTTKSLRTLGNSGSRMLLSSGSSRDIWHQKKQSLFKIKPHRFLPKIKWKSLIRSALLWLNFLRKLFSIIWRWTKTKKIAPTQTLPSKATSNSAKWLMKIMPSCSVLWAWSRSQCSTSSETKSNSATLFKPNLTEETRDYQDR